MMQLPVPFRVEEFLKSTQNELFHRLHRMYQKGFQTEIGSFSDISIIAPALGIAAVNLSSGYYNAHTLHEYINRKHLDAVIQKIGEIIADASKEDFPRYEYVDGGWGTGFGSYSHCKPPKDLPEDCWDVYDELLDYYGPDEVNGCFKAYGKGALRRMYEFVFGEGIFPHLPKIARKEAALCLQPNLSAPTGNVSP